MRENKVKVILKETFYDKRTAERIVDETNAKVVELAQAVREVKEASDYIALMDWNVRQIAEAFLRMSNYLPL